MENILIDKSLFSHVSNDNLILKRLFDISVSAITLLVLSPIFLIVALLILLDSKGPVFFSQTRIGKQAQPFKMWKFRSMYVDAEARKAALIKQNLMEGNVRFKMKTDPRITRIGHWIRKFSIDELPQFWNVLIGDMSLVGPRPPLPSEVEQYTPYQYLRLAVVPGITCVWQVSGRSDIPFEKQVDMDVEYIKNQSFMFDIILLLKTVPAVLKAQGAY
jgi:exopolysaccharide biosynthesis polyprenyl glycosylphosphotransferase